MAGFRFLVFRAVFWNIDIGQAYLSCQPRLDMVLCYSHLHSEDHLRLVWASMSRSELGMGIGIMSTLGRNGSSSVVTSILCMSTVERYHVTS